MMASPATAWFLGIAGLAAFGTAYYITTKDEEEEDVSGGDGGGTTGDGQGPITLPKDMPLPGYPPEPAGGWNTVLTPMTANTALEAVRDSQSADDGESAVRQALVTMFPVAEWAEPLSQWQKDAKEFMWDQLRGLSGWEALVGQGAPLNAPYAFWLRGKFELDACENQFPGDSAQAMKCAAEAIFPDETWPPPPNAEQWQNSIWSKLAVMAGQA